MAVQNLPSTYCWASSLLPKRPRETEFEHIGSAFQSTGARSSDFIINPDWVSESMNKVTPFGGRRHRPWSYEFQGARYWPYDTVADREQEESDYRRNVASAPVQLALEPRTVKGYERLSLAAPIHFVAQPSHTTWRALSFPGCPARDYDFTCSPDHYPTNTDPTRFQKLVSGTDQYFTSGDASGNTARYLEDSVSVTNHNRHIPANVQYYSASDERTYGDKFPMVIPERKPSRYMNFVNSEWFRS